MQVEKTMSLGQVLQADRGTARIFMEFGMHCLGCPHATAESLEVPARPMAPTWTSWCISSTSTLPKRNKASLREARPCGLASLFYPSPCG